jgi:hypothetical protein
VLDNKPSSINPQLSKGGPDLNVSFTERPNTPAAESKKIGPREEQALLTVKKALLLNGLTTVDQFRADGGPKLTLHRSGINVGVFVDNELFARVSDDRSFNDIRRELLVIELLKLMRCNVVAIPIFENAPRRASDAVLKVLEENNPGMDEPRPGNPCSIPGIDSKTGGKIRAGIVSFFGVFHEDAQARRAAAAPENYEAFGRSLAHIHKAGNMLGIHKLKLFEVPKNLKLDIEPWDQRRLDKFKSLHHRYVSMEDWVAEDEGTNRILPKYDLLKRIESALERAKVPERIRVAEWEYARQQLARRHAELSVESNELFQESPQCKPCPGLLHGDAHIGNVLFGKDPNNENINDHIITDFEWVGLGHPGWDLVPVAVAVRRFGIGSESFLRFVKGFHETIVETDTFWERGQNRNVDQVGLNELAHYSAADPRGTKIFNHMEKVRELAMTAFAFNWWNEDLPQEKRDQLWDEIIIRIATLDKSDAPWTLQ